MNRTRKKVTGKFYLLYILHTRYAILVSISVLFKGHENHRRVKRHSRRIASYSLVQHFHKEHEKVSDGQACVHRKRMRGDYLSEGTTVCMTHTMAHLAITLPILPSYSRKASEISAVEYRKLLDILSSESPILTIIMNTAKCEMAHPSIEKKPEIVVVS